MSSAALHGPAQGRALSGAPAAGTERDISNPSVHHVLDRMAGFFDHEATALVVLLDLASNHGLSPRQLVLLKPGDGGRLRFSRLARLWNGDAPALNLERTLLTMGCGALLGALLAVLAAAALLSNGSVAYFATTQESIASSLMGVLFAASVGLLAGAVVAALLHARPALYKEFDRRLRRKLIEGQWIVVAHDVPFARQHGVVALLNRRSQTWCGVSYGQRRY